MKYSFTFQPRREVLKTFNYFRKHYKEYLVDLINKNGIDPVDKMDRNEMMVVFPRAAVELPAQQQGEADENYRQRLLQVICFSEAL